MRTHAGLHAAIGLELALGREDSLAVGIVEANPYVEVGSQFRQFKVHSNLQAGADLQVTRQRPIFVSVKLQALQ